VDNRARWLHMIGPEVSMVSTLSSWLSHPAVVWGLCIFSIALVVLSIAFVPRFLATLPPDYLRATTPPRHAALPVRILRNMLGAFLVLCGLAMLVLPGQGILTLLVGVLLLDFPKKQQLVRRLLGRPKVLSIVNKLRTRHNAPPLVA
jgi:hypothetical protein